MCGALRVVLGDREHRRGATRRRRCRRGGEPAARAHRVFPSDAARVSHAAGVAYNAAAWSVLRGRPGGRPVGLVAIRYASSRPGLPRRLSRHPIEAPAWTTRGRPFVTNFSHCWARARRLASRTSLRDELQVQVRGFVSRETEVLGTRFETERPELGVVGEPVHGLPPCVVVDGPTSRVPGFARVRKIPAGGFSARGARNRTPLPHAGGYLHDTRPTPTRERPARHWLSLAAVQAAGSGQGGRRLGDFGPRCLYLHASINRSGTVTDVDVDDDAGDEDGDADAAADGDTDVTATAGRVGWVGLG